MGSARRGEIEFRNPSSVDCGGSILICVSGLLDTGKALFLPPKSSRLILSLLLMGSGLLWPPNRLEVGLIGGSLPNPPTPMEFA